MPNIDNNNNKEKLTSQGLKTLDIKGKPYVAVNERVKYFREHFPNYTLTCEIVELTEERVVMKAEVRDDKDRVISTDYAFEDRKSSLVNQSSYIENCATSCKGRALAYLNIGIDTSIASVEEVNNAMNKQAYYEKRKQDNQYSNEQILVESKENKLLQEYIELQHRYGKDFVNKIYTDHKLGKPLTDEKLETLAKLIMKELKKEQEVVNEESSNNNN